MTTFWDKPQVVKSYLIPGGIISNGLLEHDGIVASAAHPQVKHGVLQNGNFTFLSNKVGL